MMSTNLTEAGRPHLLEVGAARSHAYSLIRNTKRSHNATTLDETKVKLIFCGQMDCAPQLNLDYLVLNY